MRAAYVTTGRGEDLQFIGRFWVTAEGDAALQTVKDLRAEGQSWMKIAQALHVPRRKLNRLWALEHNPGWIQQPEPIGEVGWGRR